jgi:hypothetical protein
MTPTMEVREPTAPGAVSGARGSGREGRGGRLTNVEQEQETNDARVDNHADKDALGLAEDEEDPVW